VTVEAALPRVELVGTGPAARPTWEAVLAADPTVPAFQTPRWLDAICAATAWKDATRAYRAEDGRAMVLPLVRRALPGPLSFEGSLPVGWGTGGLVSSDGMVSSEDVSGVVSDIRRRAALRTTVRPGPAGHAAWEAAVPVDVARTRHLVQTVDLAGGFDAVWRERFSSAARRACAKAERSDLRVEAADGRRLIPVFDALYRLSVARWARQQGRPVRVARVEARHREPRRKFEAVADRLGPGCRVWVAWRGGRPAAGILVLFHGDHASYWRGAMDPEAEAGTRANQLLHRLAIEHACSLGQRFYHMGESRPDSSLARFKRGFGAQDHHYTAYRFERLPLTPATDRLRRELGRLRGPPGRRRRTQAPAR
jgi:Acetyltransferase (GNAT) domain